MVVTACFPVCIFSEIGFHIAYFILRYILEVESAAQSETDNPRHRCRGFPLGVRRTPHNKCYFHVSRSSFSSRLPGYFSRDIVLPVTYRMKCTGTRLVYP